MEQEGRYLQRQEEHDEVRVHIRGRQRGTEEHRHHNHSRITDNCLHPHFTRVVLEHIKHLIHTARNRREQTLEQEVMRYLDTERKNDETPQGPFRIVAIDGLIERPRQYSAENKYENIGHKRRLPLFRIPATQLFPENTGIERQKDNYQIRDNRPIQNREKVTHFTKVRNVRENRIHY